MLTFVVGTRPEAIKVAPVLAACHKLGIPHQVVHTGQHTTLFDQTGLQADVHLNIPREHDGTYGWALREAILDHLGQICVVQGDTVTAYAAADAANKAGISIYHIEAGIRSGNLSHPCPEERYRRMIDRWARWGACATYGNFDNLRKEGKTWPAVTHHPDRGIIGDGIFTITGNPGVDACLAQQSPIPVSHRGPWAMVTLHRRESWGEPLREMIRGVHALANRPECPILYWPVHPNPIIHQAIEEVRPTWAVQLRPPMDYPEFLNRLAGSQFVLTDSGGVQEDAATLGIPCLVAREVTDRPESVASGQALVVGRTAEGIVEGFERISELSTEPSQVFGDGHAGPRIAQHLASLLD